MTGTLDNQQLLSKIIDQLIQLFELSSKIDARTHQLEQEQQKLSACISRIGREHETLVKEIQENKLKITAINAIRDEVQARRDKRFNWILSLLLIIVSTICSYLLYLVT